MSQSTASVNTLIKSETYTRENEWVEEHDRMPLKQRLKMLHASKYLLDLDGTKAVGETISVSIPSVDIIVKKEAEDCDSLGLQSADFLGEGRVERLSLSENNAGNFLEGGGPQDCGILKVEANSCNSTNQIIVSEVTVDILGAGKERVSNVTSHNFSSGNCLSGSSGAEVRVINVKTNVKTEVPDDFLNDLDHFALRKRQKMLLARKSLELINPVGEDYISGLSSIVVDSTNNVGIGKEEVASIGKEYSTGTNLFDNIPERSTAVFCKNSEFGLSNSTVAGSCSTLTHCPASLRQCKGTEITSSANFMERYENDRISSSKNPSSVQESCGEKDILSEYHKPNLNSTLKTFINVKAEPLDTSDFDKNASHNTCLTSVVPVKSEFGINDASLEDVIDHMLLRDRMKLLTSKDIPIADVYGNSECSRKIVPSVLDNKPSLSESAKPLKIKPSKRRKKTATNSVETALEEDAPELLQVLVGKGVLIDEIKLYGQTEIDEALDDALTEDSFSELENVILKLFSQRPSLLKLDPIKCTKGEKAGYCLACLVSLVEQVRYLQFRKWPVEWGWCRDLQSFIFVFERHNRIVLERPEYGYATYCFELVDAVPIDWQVKRLITAMKLTSCSRVTLIENKTLVVGEDLSEGEARVLTEYGWIPNTGLGTMLNYRDRIVHDRKNESDGSEWRSKIGKMLMDGYNGGTIVSTDIPKKVIESGASTQSPQIKLEL